MPTDAVPNTQNKTALTAKRAHSVRLPKTVYDDLAAIVMITGRSFNTVIDNACIHYCHDYVKTEKFMQRVRAWEEMEKRDKQETVLEVDTDKPLAPLRAPGSGRAGRAGRADVMTTIVRMKPETTVRMTKASRALGLSFNDVLVEACELWASHYPTTDAFRDLAQATLDGYRGAFHRCDAAGLFQQLVSRVDG